MKKEALSVYDQFNRNITYLRISVTDRCNLRCIYCMPEDGIPLKHHTDILRLEDIAKIAAAGVQLGITKIRLTGGEPLIRKGIVSLVEMLHQIDNLQELTMTTNGILLQKYAKQLSQAGLNRVNISLDTLDPEKYRQITRGGDIQQVFAGIEAAITYNLRPVKINTVIMQDWNWDELPLLQEFARSKGLDIQYIRHMNLNNRQDIDTTSWEAQRPPPCEKCNRLRLTADGHLKPCLFSDIEIKVDLDNISDCFQKAVWEKPELGYCSIQRTMNEIGG